MQPCQVDSALKIRPKKITRLGRSQQLGSLHISSWPDVPFGRPKRLAGNRMITCPKQPSLSVCIASRVRQPCPIPRGVVLLVAPAILGLFSSIDAIGRGQALLSLSMSRARQGPPLPFQKPCQTLIASHLAAPQPTALKSLQRPPMQHAAPGNDQAEPHAVMVGPLHVQNEALCCARQLQWGLSMAACVQSEMLCLQR